MIKVIDGSLYAELIRSGIKNLERYRSALNDLNVFPVPDGDTGTNMVMTLRYGYDAVKDQSGSLSEISKRFSSSAVFGARGNSGVIVSQFFKGVSEVLEEVDVADVPTFALALQSGYNSAYAAVAKPVEGTMLTVIKDASESLASSLPLESIEDAVSVFLSETKRSLARTPELLPILKKAGVVDSGASGIVYFFEGVMMALSGDVIDFFDIQSSDDIHVDLSLFNRSSSFDFGYCFEGLLQLTAAEDEFDYQDFKKILSSLGESVVSSLEGDKIKLHIHTKKPGEIFSFCQNFGEMLTVKIENMSVQNLQRESDASEGGRFLYDPEREQASFAIVAVASNSFLQKKFFDMGADLVILSEIAPSSQDFIDAFALTGAKDILVFPNCANSLLAAEKAGDIYDDARVSIIKTKSAIECHAALSILDFDSDIDECTRMANATLASIDQYSVYHAAKDVKFGDRAIDKNDFFSLSGKELLYVSDSLDSVVLDTLESLLSQRECDVVTLFYGKQVSSEHAESLIEKIDRMGYDLETAALPTYETIYDITVTVE